MAAQPKNNRQSPHSSSIITGCPGSLPAHCSQARPFLAVPFCSDPAPCPFLGYQEPPSARLPAQPVAPTVFRGFTLQLSRAQPFPQAFPELGNAEAFMGDDAGPLGEELGPPPKEVLGRGSPCPKILQLIEKPAKAWLEQESKSSALAIGKEYSSNVTMWLWDVAPQGRDPEENNTSLMRFILQIKGFFITLVQERAQKHWCQ